MRLWLAQNNLELYSHSELKVKQGCKIVRYTCDDKFIGLWTIVLKPRVWCYHFGFFGLSYIYFIWRIGCSRKVKSRVIFS